MNVLGIDPGVRLHGWALVAFADDGVVTCLTAGHTTEDVLLSATEECPPPRLAVVEKPFYQGPARSQQSVIDTAFNAGVFADCFDAKTLTPTEWKRILFGKGSGVTSEMVAAFVERSVLNIPKQTKTKMGHIYDAICLAMAGFRCWPA